MNGLIQGKGFLRTAEEEMVKSERQEREFLREDRKDRAANLHLPADVREAFKNGL